MAVRQSAGRDQLGTFAPKFAELNDDVLFGQVWSWEEQLSLRDRSLVTVVALMAQGLTDESFRYHLISAKKTASPRRKWRRSSPTPPFTAAGPRHGPCSVWQKRSTVKNKSPQYSETIRAAAHIGLRLLSFPFKLLRSVQASAFHVAAQKRGNGLRQLIFCVAGSGLTVPDEQHQPQQIAL